MAKNESKTDALASDRATSIGDLISIGEGAIVSRVLTRTSGGNVTLFAFDRGQGLAEHAAPFDALVQVFDGRLELTIGSDAVDVGAGEIVRMPANVPHSLHSPVPTKMILTMLRELETEE